MSRGVHVVRVLVVTDMIVVRPTTSTNEVVKAGAVVVAVMADITSKEVNSGTNPLAGQVREGVGGVETVTGDILTETSMVGTPGENSEKEIVILFYASHLY